MLHPSPAPDPALQAGAGPSCTWLQAGCGAELPWPVSLSVHGLAQPPGWQPLEQPCSTCLSHCSGQVASLLSGGQAAPLLALPQRTGRGRQEKRLWVLRSWSEGKTAFHSLEEPGVGLSIPTGWTDRMHREPWDARLCQDSGSSRRGWVHSKGRTQPTQPHMWCVHTLGDWRAAAPCQRWDQAATLMGDSSQPRPWRALTTFHTSPYFMG